MSKITEGENARGETKASNTLTKGVFDFILIALLTFSLFFTVITSSATDTRWDELIPILVGAVLFPVTLYVFEVIQTVVTNIRNSMVLRRRQVEGIAHLETTVGRLEGKPRKKRKPVSRSMMETAKKNLASWFGYVKISLTFMMQNSCLTLLFWDTIKLILWLITITYWRRNHHTDDWDFSLAPLHIYRLHYMSLSLTNTELCLFILGSTDIRDVLCSALFWVNIFTLPPLTLFAKLTFFGHLSFFQIYWMLGFVIWIKYFILLDRVINLFNIGIERKSHHIWRLGFGIFLIVSAFASSMYVLQGVHPFDEKTNQFVYSLSHFGEFFYFSFITFSTVGYGDMTPLTIQAKLIAVCFVSCMLVWVPYEMNNLIQAFGGMKRISGHVSTWGSMHSFIILIGDVDPIQLSFFIFKIYYAGVKMRIIVLTSTDIEKYDMQTKQAKLLRQSLCIIKDDIGLNGRIDILHTIKAGQAAAVFLLSTFKNKNARKMDMKTVARVISLKKFGYAGEKVLIQFCSPIGPQISLHSFGNIVNLYRVKTMIIAKNITCPGIITLIMNLSLTHNATLQNFKDQGNQKQSELYKDYLTGVGKRLRFCKIPATLVGVSFETLCCNLYNRHGYITIGIMHTGDSTRSYQLNPGGQGYIIKEGDKAILIADSVYPKSMHKDIVTAGRNSSFALKDNVINMVMKNWSSAETEGDTNPEPQSELEDVNMTHSNSSQSSEGVFFPAVSSLVEPVSYVDSIVVSSVTFACRYLFENSTRPIIAIVGYSDFLLQLLLYFEEMQKFNVVLFERELSLKVNLNILRRFKSFLAVIDGDPMKMSDVNRAELEKACYIYVLPSPELCDPNEPEEDQDLRTIVIYRHLKSIIQGKISEKKTNNPYANIFSLVELHNASNVTYLDNTKWSAWNAFDRGLDPSLSYINAVEYSMGQFISDEMLYGLTMNTMLINEDYAFYKILLDLVSLGELDNSNKGIELISIRETMMDFNKRTFGHMFNYLFTRMNKILIGIYRVGDVPMENCVICAPPPNFLVRHADMVYVISKDYVKRAF